MNVDELAPQALKLPGRDRALLAALLWESLESPYDSAVVPGDDEAIALAEARDREIESGAVKPISHAELMGRLRG